MTPIPNEIRPHLETIFKRKPKAVTALDVEEFTTYTSWLIIVEAGSQRQVTSLAEHILKALKGKDIRALGTEGVKEGEWALLDFGDLIIHVFESRAKTFYDLEGLWSDATPMDLSQFGPLPEPGEFDDGF